MPDKAGFPHYMLKEIHEQPRGVRQTFEPRLAGDRVVLPELGISDDVLHAAARIRITGSGSSRHAGLAGRYMIEELAGIPVEVEHASEFANRPQLIRSDELVVAITQSGETADTLAALRAAKSLGVPTLAIANVAQSTIAREASGVLYSHAGREVSIASTKSFTGQLTVIYLFALYLSQLRGTMADAELAARIAALRAVPAQIEDALRLDSACRALAERCYQAAGFLYLGRGVHYPVALDGALKLKEVSYIHAEGYPAGEMKHGPNALIDETLPVVFVATRDREDAGSMIRFQKTLSNLKEVKARGGNVIAVVNRGDEAAVEDADHLLAVPAAPELLLPLIEIVPLQLLAYHIAVLRGCDVDRPRNLAKAVLAE